MNYSFAFGIFPDILTLAKVVPVSKSGNKRVVTNYRPISLFSNFSKIFEKLLYQRLDTFIRKHSIISPFQYGSQAGHSTKHAVTDVITMAYDNINDKKFTCVSFLDIKKAFDSVDHDILINKLEHYGIRGNANDLLKSYLSQRKQFIVIDEQSSKLYPIKWGVPQGSTLGPLFFILYINDLANCTLVKPRLFADDTCLVYSADTIDNLSKVINQDMVNISNWMQANRLCLTPKSQICIPPEFNSPSTSPEINIFYDGSPITISKSAKYLGVYIDDELNFKTHIKLLYTKLSRSLGILPKVKNYLPKKSLLHLYFALFHSHLLYCVTIWFSTYQTYTAPISKLQDRAIKLYMVNMLITMRQVAFISH